MSRRRLLRMCSVNIDNGVRARMPGWGRAEGIGQASDVICLFGPPAALRLSPRPRYPSIDSYPLASPPPEPYPLARLAPKVLVITLCPLPPHASLALLLAVPSAPIVTPALAVPSRRGITNTTGQPRRRFRRPPHASFSLLPLHHHHHHHPPRLRPPPLPLPPAAASLVALRTVRIALGTEHRRFAVSTKSLLVCVCVRAPVSSRRWGASHSRLHGSLATPMVQRPAKHTYAIYKDRTLPLHALADRIASGTVSHAHAPCRPAAVDSARAESPSSNLTPTRQMPRPRGSAGG